MWPWERFDWGAFWAILAAAFVIACVWGGVQWFRESMGLDPGWNLSVIRQKVCSIDEIIQAELTRK